MYLLYIKHSLTDPYIMVGQFDSSFAAQQYLDENYKGFAHKIMSESDAIAMAKRKEERKTRRKQMISKPAKAIVAGAKQLDKEIKSEVKAYEDKELARLRRAVQQEKFALKRMTLEQKMRPTQPMWRPPSILLHPPFPTPQPAPAPVKRKKYKKKSKKKAKKKWF